MENSAQTHLSTRPSLRVGKRLHLHRPGETLAEVISQEAPGLLGVDDLHVYLDGDEVYRHVLCQVRPKSNAIIEVAVGPRGDQPALIRSLAIIAVTVAAVYTGGAAFGAAGAFGTSGGAAGAFGASTIGSIAVQSGFFALGMLAINAVLPPPGSEFDNGERQSQSLSVQASRNRLEPYGVMPMLLGTHRIYPPFATKAFSTLAGKDTWVTMMYCLGYKNIELDLTTIKFGDTLLTDLLASDEYQIQYDTGGSNDTPGGITIFPGSVDEQTINLKVNGPDPSDGVEATTPAGTEWMTVDLSAPLGLLRISNNGKNYDDVNVGVVIEISLSGSGTWEEVYRETWNGRSANPILRSFEYTFDTPGEWTVRVYRTTADTDPTQISSSVYNDDIVLRTLRSFTSTMPVDDPDAALIALKVKATDNFNGTPDTFNLIASQLVPDWDGASWVDNNISSNPASLARYMWTGIGNAKPLDLSRIDDEVMQDFHDFCVSKAFTFNQYFDSNGTLWDRLVSCCASGRGRIMQPDGKWLVKYDDVQITPVAIFSPRNSWGYQGGKVYPDEIHGFRVRFISDHQGLYANDEIIVYRQGYSEDGSDGTQVGTLFEALQLPGVTDSTQIWKLARYYLNVLEYQMESHSILTDPINLRLTPMDRINYQDDAILVGYGSGRIKVIDGLEITLDTVIEIGEGSNAIRITNEFGQITTIIIEEENVETDTVTLSVTPSISFAVQDFVVVGLGGKIDLPLIVKDIIPGVDESAKIVCVPYSDSVYVDDGSTVPPYDPLITQPAGKDIPVINADSIRSDEAVLLRNNDGSLTPRIQGTFAFVNNRENVAFVIVQYRVEPTTVDAVATWNQIPILAADAKEFWITDVVESLDYEMRSRFQYRDGINGSWSTVVLHTVIGKTSKPFPPDFLYVSVQADGTRQYNWSYTKDGTSQEGELGTPVDLGGVEIRYWDLADGDVPAWEDMVRLNSSGWITESPVEFNAPTQGTYVFCVKAIDTGGRESENPYCLSPIVLGPNRVANTAFYRDYRDLGWPIASDTGPDDGLSRRENCHIEESIGALVADGDTTWEGLGSAPDPATVWNDLDNWSHFTAPDYTYVTEEDDLGSNGNSMDFYFDFTVTNIGSGSAELWVSTVDNVGASTVEPNTGVQIIVQGQTISNFRKIRFGLYMLGVDIASAIIELKISGYLVGTGPSSANVASGDPVITPAFVKFVKLNGDAT